MHDGNKKYVNRTVARKEKRRSFSGAVTLGGRAIVNKCSLGNVN
jgi:hypothetical protein